MQTECCWLAPQCRQRYTKIDFSGQSETMPQPGLAPVPFIELLAAGSVVTSEVQSQDVTQLLIQWSQGDERALTALTPLVYDELRRLARSYLRRENPGHTLQSTALVHEAFVRLVDQRVAWNSRAHFFGIAAQMMRRILVDHAKAKATAKRGWGAPRLELDEHLAASPKRDVHLAALDEALERLSRIDPQRALIVEAAVFWWPFQ